MAIDRKTLSLLAPVLSTAGSLFGLMRALRQRNGVIVATLSLIGTLAWAAAAFQDAQDDDSGPVHV